MTARGPCFQPVFLNSTAGRIFAVYYPAQTVTEPRRAVLYLPPFAEELNRSRRVTSVFARRLAAQGCATLLLDPYGCGDSDGDFADARWETWRSDVQTAADWLGKLGHNRIALVGLRLGALLALAGAAGSASIMRIILWQPVLRGDQMLRQFLRLRLAGRITGTVAKVETTTALRTRLRSAEPIEIAGYELAGPLALAIDGLDLGELGLACDQPIDWIEIGPAEAPLSPAQLDILARWRTAGRLVQEHRAIAEPFWSLQETTLAPRLLEVTISLLTSYRA